MKNLYFFFLLSKILSFIFIPRYYYYSYLYQKYRLLSHIYFARMWTCLKYTKIRIPITIWNYGDIVFIFLENM